MYLNREYLGLKVLPVCRDFGPKHIFYEGTWSLTVGFRKFVGFWQVRKSSEFREFKVVGRLGDFCSLGSLYIRQLRT